MLIKKHPSEWEWEINVSDAPKKKYLDYALCKKHFKMLQMDHMGGAGSSIEPIHPLPITEKPIKYQSSGGASSPIFAMRSLKTRSRGLNGSDDDMRSGSLRDPEPNLHLPQKTGNILNHLTPNFCKLICVNKTHKRDHPNNSSNYRTSSLSSFFGFLSKSDPYP